MSHPNDIPDTNTQEIGKPAGTQNIESPLIGIAKRFMDFCISEATPFQSKTRSREPQMQKYVSGLVQSDKKKNISIFQYWQKLYLIPMHKLFNSSCLIHNGMNEKLST